RDLCDDRLSVNRERHVLRTFVVDGGYIGRGAGAHSHLRPVTLTPGGGAGSSGTKKVGANGSSGSTRYFSKSVTPLMARKLSSIRKFPVKLRAGFWKTR